MMEININITEDIIDYILINLDLTELIIMRSLSKKYQKLLTSQIRKRINRSTRFITDNLELEKLFYLCKIKLTKTCIFAGCDSSFIVTDEEKDPTTLSQVYAFGDNQYGQLGLKHINNINQPTIVKKLHNIVQICSNETQTLLLTNQGDVYTCGANFYGDLQPQFDWVCKEILYNESGDYISLQLIKNLSNIKQITANSNCFVVLDHYGKVYIISSQLLKNGIFSVPLLIKDLTDIVHISINDLFGLTINDKGIILGFSLDILNEINIPIIVDEINDVASIINNKLLLNNGETRLLTIENHQSLVSSFASHAVNMINYDSYHLNDHDISDVVQIALGAFHSLFLTINGEVYSTGDNIYGQLGIGFEALHTRTTLYKINLSNVVKIAAGNYHSLFLTAEGKVYTCGKNDKGQLGIGKRNCIYVPVEILY